MPRISYPGVYVEEVDAKVRPIAGVETTSDTTLVRLLAAELDRTIRLFVPDWTDHAPSDPGITVLEAFAWIAENPLYTPGATSAREREAAMRAVLALARLAGTGESQCAPLKRPRFSPGQLLDDDDLTAEVDYHRAKLQRHNRNLLGWGIAWGLGVRVETDGDAKGGRVVVEPGYAIDRAGTELAVPCSARLNIPAAGDGVFVTIRAFERPCSMAPARDGEPPEPTAVEEACLIGIGPTAPEPAIAIARLQRTADGWQVDRSFTPPRLRGRVPDEP